MGMDTRNAKISHEILTEFRINTMGREELIQYLMAAKDCLLSMEKLSDEYGLLEQKAKEIMAKKDSMENISLVGLMLGVIGCILGGTFIISALGDGDVLLLFLGILITFLSIKYIKKWNRKIDQVKAAKKVAAQEYYDKEYPPVVQKMQEIEDSARNLLETVEYKNMTILLPEDYMNIDSVSSLIRLLQNRRANGLAEALNLYENDLHQQRMEEAAKRSVAAQERSADVAERSLVAQERSTIAVEQQVAYAKQISKNTKSTARAAKLDTFVNYMNYSKQNNSKKK